MTDNSTPLVSIVAPMFNVEKYVESFVHCIRDQTYTNWELILVDDGSTDNTLNLAQKISDSRVNVIRRNRLPKGSVTCRNIGQLLVKGDYFIHFDADDLIAPYCLEQRVAFMNRHPDVDFATFRGGTVIEGENGSIIHNNKKWGVPLGDDDLCLFLSTKYPYSVWNNIYRTLSFKEFLWDERVQIYTDFSFIVPAIIQKKKHAYDITSKDDYYYRMGQSNAMTQEFISDEKYLSTKYLFDKTINLLNALDNPQLYKNAFYSFFKLQFFRLLLDGTQSQIDDFYLFIINTYKDRTNSSIRLSYCLIKPLLKHDSEKKNYQRKLVAYVTLQPKSIIRWVKLKHLRKHKD